MARAIRQAKVTQFFQGNFGDDYRQFSSPTLAALVRQ